MADYFIGEIRMFASNTVPKNWAFCNGQELPIAQNPALFSLLGTTYGGDGITKFKLPDLRGRVPVHYNGPMPIGATGGTDKVALLVTQLPPHQHRLGSTVAATTVNPAKAAPALATQSIYGPIDRNVKMGPGIVGAAGGGQAHENRQPLLAVHFIIALQGSFPGRN